MTSGFFISLIPLSFSVIGVVIAITAIAVAANSHQANAQHQNSYSNQKRKQSQNNSRSSTKPEVNFGNEIKNPCNICGSTIKNLYVDLSKLPCDHEFHTICISSHFRRNKFENEARCPVEKCAKPYSLQI